jgi:hypothetical protein
VLRQRRTIACVALDECLRVRAALVVGRSLHDETVHTMRDWACVDAQLWAVAGNQRAQAFYRRNGWAEDGTRATHTIGSGTVEIIRYVRKLSAARGRPKSGRMSRTRESGC